jgi:hypothetical protein
MRTNSRRDTFTATSSLVKTRLAKSVLDAGWGMLKAQLQYKSREAGKCVLIVNERNTTRSCSNCKALTGPKGLDMLAVRTWVCGGCGGTHDRDVNCGTKHPVRGEVLAVPQRERVIVVSRPAEPGISPAQGRERRADGGGMNTGSIKSNAATMMLARMGKFILARSRRTTCRGRR